MIKHPELGDLLTIKEVATELGVTVNAVGKYLRDINSGIEYVYLPANKKRYVVRASYLKQMIHIKNKPHAGKEWDFE